MAIEAVADPYSLIGENFPADDEVKFTATSAALAGKVDWHTEMADAYRTAIARLSPEVFDGLSAEKTRAELGKLADRHDEETQFNQKFSESVGSLAQQIITTKNRINSECLSATAKIEKYEAAKETATDEDDRQEAQRRIDRITEAAREDIKSLNDMLERNMTEAEAELDVLTAQMEAAQSAITPGTPSAGSPDEAFAARSAPAPDAAMAARGDVLGGSGGTSPAGGGMPDGAGTQPLSTPAPMMGAMPAQMPQPAPAAGGTPSGGGSQLPGQELASKAMDMAQQGMGPDTYLSDDAVKNLLDASADTTGADGNPNPQPGDTAAGISGGVGPTNPTVASGPSPATPVTTPRPPGGASLPLTELAGAAPSAPAPPTGTGLTAATTGLGGLGGAVPSTVPAATTPAPQTGGLGPGLTPMPTAGAVAMPTTPGTAPTPPASPPPPPPASPATPAASSPPSKLPPPPEPPTPPTAPPPLVAMPPVIPGVTALPPSLRVAPPAAAFFDQAVPPVLTPVRAAPPQRLEHLPEEQRITILNTASIITQMRQAAIPPSIATALLHDGTTFAVVIATADDISILPPDIAIPQPSLLLNRFHLGEDFRTQWAGCADTITKLIAAVDAHPDLNRSMILHASAFTTRKQMHVPAIPFTPISMDAAWAIRFLYTPPALTTPAYTLREETFTAEQIEYLLHTAERTWQLPTKRLHREGQARLESASMYASRWSTTGEVGLTSTPRGYDYRIAGHLYAATREALLANDLERASWYGQYLRYQTLPTAAAKNRAA